MSYSIDNQKIELWCEDAITILASIDLPEDHVRMIRRTVAQHSGKSAIYSIADELAVMLNYLPDDDRMDAQQKLMSAHGFGFDFFVDRKMKSIRSILKRGKIKNDVEYYNLAEFASNTTNSPALISAADTLLSMYRPKA